MRRQESLTGWKVLCAAALAGAGLMACAGEGGSAASSATPGSPDGRYEIGRAATATEIAALDIDAAPGGHGLPAGRGDAMQGKVLYQEKCAVCHGANGQGVAPYPALIGREPRTGFPFAADFKLPRTIGNYWPYATTLFDYIRRAMPLAAPGSLSTDDVYSLTAYLLAANEIVPTESALDSASLVAVKMPAHDRFVVDDRRGGRELR